MTEKTFLLTTAIGSFLISCMGIAFSFMATSQAILLDGLFNLVYFIASLLTIRIASLVQQGDSETFHFGYAYFEPMINGAKGALVLGVTIMAFVGSIQALLSGGSTITAGPAILYGGIASTICWGLSWITRRGARSTKSPLVQADAENWLVNAAISSAVFLAFICIYFLKEQSLKSFRPTLILFLLS